MEESLLVEAYTALLFLSSCAVVAGLVFSYGVVSLVRRKWLQFVVRRFPSLDFVEECSIGAALDTPRNPGVVTLLLSVRGVCQIHALRRRINEELLVKRSDSRASVSRLRMVLTSRLGWYAWAPCINFNIDNHVVVAPVVYRGRPVSSLNLQECVNEMVSGKLPTAEQPPWQVTVIPTCGDRYYLLLRMHHMLSSSAVTLAQLLPVCTSPAQGCEGSFIRDQPAYVSRECSLTGLYKQPRALTALKEQICEALCGWHTRALAKYHPRINPRVLVKPDIQTVCGLSALWVVSFLHGPSVVTASSLMTAMKYCLAPWPVVVMATAVVKLVLLKLPLACVCEVYALTMVHDQHYSGRSFIKSGISSWTRVQGAISEVGYYWRIVYQAPRIILEELYGARSHYLHTTPHRSRKVVSWSQPVPVTALRAIEEACGVSPTDILLTATAAAVRDLFLVQGAHPPPSITAYARTITLNDLFNKPCDSGLVCLQLPLNNQWQAEALGDGPITELRIVQQGVLRMRLKQSALYLASMFDARHQLLAKCLPDCAIRMLMNHLTRRISFNVTQVVDKSGGQHHAHLWDHPVHSLMYWPPLQANSCLSLTLLSHGDTVSLGVMADSAMAPHHHMLAATWPGHVRRLAAAAGVGCAFPRPRALDTPPADVDSDASPTSSASASEDSSDCFTSDDDA